MPEITDAELAEYKKACKAVEKAKLEASLAKDALKKAQDATAAAKSAGEAELAKVRAGYERGSVFDKSGVEDAKVRRYFELDFEEQAARDGGESDFAKWFGALDAEKAPHLAPFLPTPTDDAGGGATDTKPAAGGGGGRLPNTATGGRAPASSGAFTAEKVAAMTTAEFAANRDAIALAHPELGLTPLPKRADSAA